VFVILSMLFAACIFAQQDTLLHTTSEVEIQAERNSKPSSLVLRPIIFDDKKAPHNLDLGAWLERMGLAQINRNGAPGAAATVRFRGLSSDHTQMLWNGIPINSIALGTCDLSMMPAFLFDGMYFSEGAGVNSNLIPGLGATMNLRNFESDSSFFCSALAGYNSLLNRHLAGDIHFSQKIGKAGYRFASRTKVFDQIYQNKFNYTDEFQLEKPVAEQLHNDGRNTGLTQDLSLTWKRNELKGSFWHQQRSIELPVTMGFEQNSQVYQDDEFSRASISFNQKSARRNWQMGYAFNHEKLHWSDNDNPLFDSRYKILSHTASFLVDQKVWDNFMVQLNGAIFHNNILNNGYGSHEVVMNSGQTGITVVYGKGIHHAEAASRIDIRTSNISPAYSIQYAIKPRLKNSTKTLEFQFSGSRKFRLPDFNELYWNPGGNRDLKPEAGVCGIVSARYSKSYNNLFNWNVRTQIYYNDVKDWIQWQPTANQYWTPVNIKHVRTKGGELQFGIHKKTVWGEIQLSTMAELNFAEGQNSLDKEEPWYTMIYSPGLRSGNSLSVRYHTTTCTFNHQIVAKRYTDESNSELRALPSYQLYHVFLTRDIKIKTILTTLSCGVDNIFDVRYESVRGYALPGRVFTMQVKITI
jgi:vitamin B12 transporter